MWVFVFQNIMAIKLSIKLLFLKSVWILMQKKMIIIFTSNSDQNKIRILYKETTLIRWTIEVFGFLSEKII